MKKTIIFLLFLCFYTISSYAQNDEMKKWMDYSTPGKEHKDLAKMTGDWTYTLKFWMDPSGAPMTSDGTAQFEMLLGGRYQQMKVSGKMMGMDFNGIGVTGFDNGKKIWESSWIDNFGTGLMYMAGTFDEASKKIVFKGKSYDPMSGKDMESRQTIKVVDDKTFEMEMFNIANGTEFKSMEMVYTKK